MIAIVDYGAGNLHSVRKAVETAGGQAMVTADSQVIAAADKVILPGVGAFKDGMDGLSARGLVEALQVYAESGRPLLGICLGMQLLFDRSEEQGEHRGLGIMPGDVLAFDPARMKVPQIGWNQLVFDRPAPALDHVAPGSYVYFNHSYYCVPRDAGHVLATTDYGRPFASVVGAGKVTGFQFHPEKSQRVGLQLLRNFVEVKP